MSTPTLVQPRPTLEDFLQQTTRQWHGYIANKDDAITVGQNIILSGHIGPDQGEGEEYDYPMTPEDESQLVRILYEAMCDFSDPFEERNGQNKLPSREAEDGQRPPDGGRCLGCSRKCRPTKRHYDFENIFGSYADTEPAIRWPSRKRTVDTTATESAMEISSTRSSGPLVPTSGLSSTLVEFVIPNQVTSSCPSLTASFPGVQESRLQSARSQPRIQARLAPLGPSWRKKHRDLFSHHVGTWLTFWLMTTR